MNRRVQLGLAAGLILLAFAGVSAWFVFRFDPDVFREPIEAELTKLLDRPVKLGRLSTRAGFLRPHILVEDLVVLADPVSEDELARIDQARISLDLIPLLRRTLQIDSIALDGLHVSLGTNAAGKPMWPLRLTREASGEGGKVHVEVENVDLEAGNVAYHDGKGGEAIRALIDMLELDIHPSGRLELSARGSIEGKAVQLKGRIEPPSDPDEAGARQRISLQGRVDDVSLEASGTAKNALDLTGLDLALEASAPHLPLPDDWGEKLTLEPVKASARVVAAEGGIRLEGADIEVGTGGKRLHLTGQIEDLFGEPHGTLAATLELPNIRTLSPVVEMELPDLGPVRGTLALRGAGDELHLEAIDVTAGGKADKNGQLGQRLHVEGTISDLTGLVALDLQAQASAPDLRGLVPGLDPKLAELGPLRVGTQVLGEGSIVHLRGIDATLGRENELWASAKGQIDLVAGAEDVKLEVTARSPTTRRLESLVGRKLPEVGPVAATASLRGTLRRLLLSRGEVRLGPAGRTRLVMKGGSVALPPGDVFHLDAELRAPDLNTLGKLLDVELPAKGPVEATATLRATRKELALHDLRARIHRTTLTGSAARVQDAKGRHHFTLALASPELHVSDVMPEPRQDDPGDGPSFRERRLPIDVLRAQDAELVLDFTRVLGRRGLDLEGLKMRVTLENGRLDVDPFSFQWQVAERGGPVSVDAGVDARGPEPSWWLRAKANRIDMNSVAAQFTETEPVEGAGLLIADLTSRGETGQQLLEGLSGDLTLALRNAVLHGRYVLLLRRDLISALALERVREDKTSSRCILARFQLEAGVATAKTLLLDSKEVILHGKGSIDAGRERYDLVLTPKSKRPGIGLTQPIAIGGTFQKPKVRPVKMALAMDAAKATLGTLLLPGVGTIAPFLHLGTRGRDPCQEALTKFVGPE